VRISLELWCERLDDGAKTSAGTASVRVEALPGGNAKPT
jgi:hypothetical protein